jgi:hypothetical protein
MSPQTGLPSSSAMSRKRSVPLRRNLAASRRWGIIGGYIFSLYAKYVAVKCTSGRDRQRRRLPGIPPCDGTPGNRMKDWFLHLPVGRWRRTSYPDQLEILALIGPARKVPEPMRRSTRRGECSRVAGTGRRSNSMKRRRFFAPLRLHEDGRRGQPVACCSTRKLASISRMISSLNAGRPMSRTAN